MPHQRNRVQRAGSALFFVQFASRGLPALQRAGRRGRVRYGADRSRRRQIDPRRRGRTVGALPQQPAFRRIGSPGTEIRLYDRRSDRIAERGGVECRVVRRQRTVTNRCARIGRYGQLHGFVGRRSGLYREAARRFCVQQRGQMEGTIRRPARMQRLRRQPATQGSALFQNRRKKHRRIVGAQYRGIRPLDGRHRKTPFEKTGADRTRNPERDPRTTSFSAGRRTGLPVAEPQLAFAVRRGEPADPTGDSDRVETGQRALHPRRTEHRIASARQYQTDQQSEGIARRGEFGNCRGTRRRHDPQCRLGRGRRAASRCPRRRGRGIRNVAAGYGVRRNHGRLPDRPPADRTARKTPHGEWKTHRGARGEGK